MILPYTESLFSAWPEDCFLSSVIMTKKNAMEWILDNYIQIGSYKGEITGEKYRISFWPTARHHHLVNLYDYCPFIVKNALEYDYIEKTSDDICDFLEQAIDLGYYASLTVDQFYRKERNGCRGFLHPIYLYGYDSSEKCFYTGDCYDNWKYAIKKVSYENLREGYDIVASSDVHIGKRRVYLYSVVDCKFDFDIERVALILNDYLNAEDNTAYHDRYYVNKFYGIDCYRGLSDYLKSRTDKKVDLSSFVMLCDHKKIMERRIKKLCETGVDIDSDVFLKMNEITKMCETMLNVGIKYNLTGKNNTLENLNDMLNEFIISETEIITRVRNKICNIIDI